MILTESALFENFKMTSTKKNHESRLEKMILFTLLFTTLLYSVSTAAVNTQVKNGIKTLMDHANHCDTVKFVLDSVTLSSCKNLTLPVNQEDKTDLMCILMFDIAEKTCIYNSQLNTWKRGSNYEIKVPETGQIFDQSIKELEPTGNKFEEFIEDICQNGINYLNQLNSLVETNQSIVPIMQNMTSKLSNPIKCAYFCEKTPKTTVEPICLILKWAGDLLKDQKPIDQIIHQEENTSSPQNVENDKKNVNEKKNENDTKMKVQNTEKVSTKSADSVSQPKVQQVQVEKTLENPTQAINKNSEKTEDTNDKIADKVNPLQDTKKTDIITGQSSTDTNSKQIDDSPNVAEDQNPDNDINSLENHQAKNGNENDEDTNEQDDMDEKEDLDKASQSQGRGNSQVDLRKFRDSAMEDIIQRQEEESHYFAYFTTISLICFILYIGYHNKQKLFAMILEGRRSRRGRGSRRRPSTANYRKLDSNLEEAVTSQCNSNATNIIY
ncbi:putative leucine-rich repeat-containing protein DDB_G0290503 [Trichogramma pretiosum]|uniref:putative leucine-rich repeat-containing protein DDB_G0290503 n=1 Tax=Trichogramma pretiosum TaxID=7493 RepID=UPI0006C96633|nr:putative leucine-rich repeat-containing protein DDB_G0290503 [Trichogramma pretiosum]